MLMDRHMVVSHKGHVQHQLPTSLIPGNAFVNTSRTLMQKTGYIVQPAIDKLAE